MRFPSPARSQHMPSQQEEQELLCLAVVARRARTPARVQLRTACRRVRTQSTHSYSLLMPLSCSAQRHGRARQHWQQRSARTVRAVRARASAGLHALTRACNTRSLTHSAHSDACLQAWRKGAASGPRSSRRGSASLQTMGLQQPRVRRALESGGRCRNLPC